MHMFLMVFVFKVWPPNELRFETNTPAAKHQVVLLGKFLFGEYQRYGCSRGDKMNQHNKIGQSARPASLQFTYVDHPQHPQASSTRQLFHRGTCSPLHCSQWERWGNWAKGGAERREWTGIGAWSRWWTQLCHGCPSNLGTRSIAASGATAENNIAASQ